MSTIRPDQFTPPHKGNSQRAAQGLGSFYMSAEGLNQGEMPEFVPLVAQDYAGTTLGSIPTESWNLSEIVETPSFSSNRSAKLGRNLALGDPIDPNNCGGAVFGGRVPMVKVPLGSTVWQRFRMYIPSTFSWGYAYSNGETDNPCGRPTDGFGETKWLVFSPDVGTARIYMNLGYNQKRSVEISDPAEIVIAIESGARTKAVSYTLPTDEWFSLQMAVKVSNTGDGYVRQWVNDAMINEMTNVSTVANDATGIDEWGLSAYWNGVPWSDGAANRDSLYVDDIIVATNAPGYAPPPTTDAAGNNYIANTMLAGNF